LIIVLDKSYDKLETIQRLVTVLMV